MLKGKYGETITMKKCEEKWKLKWIVIGTKNEVKSIFPSPANGRVFTKKNREDIKKLRKGIVKYKEEYKSHLENCVICNS